MEKIVLLMMMKVFAPSAANASDDTTTSDLGSGLSSATTSGSQSKNSHSYLKLIVCCFLSNSCPHTKFHQNQTKNKEVNRLAIGWLWLVGPVSQKIAVFISNSFYLVFSPM